MRYSCFFAFLIVLWSPAYSQNDEEQSAYTLVRQMFARTKEINSMTYTMKKKERIMETMPSQETEVKLNLHPFKVYLKQKSPKSGLEVLYIQGTNNNKALINTNGFPWVNVHLDPMGSTMRENQHHTLFESGYSHLMSILEHLTTKYQKDLETMITKSGPVQWDGHSCWIITFTNPNFRYTSYKVQKGEDVLSIARKFKLSEHMILEKNGLSDFYNVEGRSLEVPNDYSPKLELYIDQSRLIPLVMKVYDEKGLYEYYEYSNVKLNPTFSADEFDKNNEKYGF